MFTYGLKADIGKNLEKYMVTLMHVANSSFQHESGRVRHRVFKSTCQKQTIQNSSQTNKRKMMRKSLALDLRNHSIHTPVFEPTAAWHKAQELSKSR